MVANSFQMDLSLITQTEHYAGLFKSSPKVTCHLSGDSGLSDPNGHETGFESWECEVCGNRNPPGLSPAAARICSLCGVPRTSFPLPSTSVLSEHISSSLPSSTSASFTATPVNDPERNSIACPACTFLNHPSLRSCEICSTDLPQLKREYTKSAPSSRSDTPVFGDIDQSSKKMIKISFRKGGDKAFYAVLKRSLRSKAWEVRKPISRFLSTGNIKRILYR
jgi:ESCRT-II complex subunit VPS36